ncbi:sulfhydryl oxidase 2-like isoform X2 [Oratosquilla oratoria]
MRMFGARVTKGDVGTPLAARSTPVLQNCLIDFLVKQEIANNGSKSWVNLKPSIINVSEISKTANEHHKNVAVIVEQNDSYVGRSSILDLGGFKNILIYHVEHNSLVGMVLSDDSLPAVILVDQENGKSIETKITTREQMTALIAKHFNLDRKTLHFKEALKANKTEDWSKKDEAEGGGDGKPEEISSDKLGYDDDLPDSAYVNRNPIDQIFMIDIENALSYALRHEVSSHKIITGEALEAVQNFLSVAHYLPVRPKVLKFLSDLHDYAVGHDDVIRGEDFLNKINSLQSSEMFLPEQREWVGCKGSNPKYRGYPCGLWTTFHSLTVNAVLMDGERPDFNPLMPLRAIYTYVKHFFSCSYCSEHFQEMYNEDAEQSVHNPEDGILWLWRGHNKVNKRLKGHPSEDPEHPKQPFPSQTACPECWNSSGNYNETNVLRYLKSVYSRGAISLKDTQVTDTKVRNRQSKVYEALQNDINIKETSQQGRLKINQKRMNYETSVPSNSWGFNNTDISLCVMLYGLSTIILVSVYLTFVIKKKMRRKKFFEKHQHF